MSDALAPITDKLKPLIRLLSSDRDGEVVAAARAIIRTLKSANLDIHALADGIGPNGKKFTEQDAIEIYRQGRADERREAEQQAGPSWRNVTAHDEPSWYDIAIECQQHRRLYEGREPDFVASMVRKTVLGGQPSEKEANWLRKIYARKRVV